MAVGGHSGWPKITFDRISRHFRSIRFFFFLAQNGCRRPFWITENHFRSHFWPFQINTQLFFLIFFSKWLPAHLGWPKITFDPITRHFRSIRNFFFQNGGRLAYNHVKSTHSNEWAACSYYLWRGLWSRNGVNMYMTIYPQQAENIPNANTNKGCVSEWVAYESTA